MVRDEKLEKLRHVPLFSHLGGREIERLGMLTDELDVSDGQVAIEKDGQRVASMHPGDFLGEIALIDGRPRTATARAEGRTRLLVLSRGSFNDLMDEFPSVRGAVLEALAERVRSHESED